MSEKATIARPYAKAIFELALKSNAFKEWSLQLKQLTSIVENKSMQPVLNNPLFLKQDLIDMFIDLGGKGLTQQGQQLVKSLAQKKRLSLLPMMSKLYEKFLAEHEKTMEVEVVSAYPIDSVRLQQLTHALQNKLKRQITIRCTVDKSLVGGAIIYAEDKVIDGSLRNKLKRLSERLCN
jgi:F-type H+-transporting ATPase subunit delta